VYFALIDLTHRRTAFITAVTWFGKFKKC